MNKRVLISILMGGVLGVFCIVGANLRYDGSLSTLYLFSFWFNRLLMGFVIGLLPARTGTWQSLLRGLAIGLLVSFAFYSATDFRDLTGFLAGGVYGVLIELVAKKVA